MNAKQCHNANISRLNLIPTVKNTPRLLLTRLTETDIATFIGNAIETHSLQYNVMGKAFINRDQLALQLNQQSSSQSDNRRYNKITSTYI